ncbi:MAG: hypothetical protein ACRDY6_12255 [Acidimicrobiia bacterium]
MRRRGVLVGAFVTALGAVAASVRVLRALPLVNALPTNDGGSGKKDDKKDMKKKGNGPRTRRKKAKKGKA